MRRTLVLSLFLLLTACLGCGSAPEPKIAEAKAEESIEVHLEGTWKGEVVVNDAEAAKANPDAIALIKSMKMQMTFTEDGVLKLAGETNGQPYNDENSWQYVDQKDNVLTIKSVTADGKEKDHDFYFNDSHSFDMPLAIETAQVGAMRFTRVR